MKPFRPSRARPAPKPCRLSNSPCAIKLTKLSQLGRYELQEISQPALVDILMKKYGVANKKK